MGKVKAFAMECEEHFIERYGYKPTMKQLDKYVQAWGSSMRIANNNCPDCIKKLDDAKDFCNECSNFVCSKCWTMGHSHYTDRNCE